MKRLLLFHLNNIYANTPQYYATLTFVFYNRNLVCYCTLRTKHLEVIKVTTIPRTKENTQILSTGTYQPLIDINKTMQRIKSFRLKSVYE